MEPIDPNPVQVPRGLQQAAAYAWRILLLCVLAYVVLFVLSRLELVVIALFLGLILAALVGPIVRALDTFLPRPIAVALGLIALLAVFGGIITFITTSVTNQWDSLSQQFVNGIAEIQHWLQGPPFSVDLNDFNDWYANVQQWVIDHRGDLASGALGSAATAVEALAVLALAVFSAICFLSGGANIWRWGLKILPAENRSRVDGAGMVAWRSFAGYTRGIIIVAACNSIFVCILLLILGVPLAVPLALIVFFGTFIPLVGAPIAMLIAVIVALAAKGPIIALIVLVGIFLLGQLEGHVLQPLVMSKAVNIHPLAVAVAVASGTILAGLFGAVIAVPVVSVIYGIAKFWYQTKPPAVPPTAAAIES